VDKRFRLAVAITLLTLFVLMVGAVRRTPLLPAPPYTLYSLAAEAKRKLGQETGGARDAEKDRWIGHKSTARYVVIDTHTNRLYWRTADRVLHTALCSTGSGAELSDSLTGRHWRFETPKGIFTVDEKLRDPWWRRPDWAFIEEGDPIPEEARDRLDPNAMGDYAIGFGDGYFIHGTLYARLLGVAVTHGCVRLGDADLELLYSQVRTGTPVIIF